METDPVLKAAAEAALKLKRQTLRLKKYAFKKGQSGNPGGRKKMTVRWAEAKEALLEALPRIITMNKNDLSLLLQANPTGAEMITAKYAHEHISNVVDKFIGRTPDVGTLEITGKGGAPLGPAPDPAKEIVDKEIKDVLLTMIRDTKAKMQAKAQP